MAPLLSVERLAVHYGDRCALSGVDIEVDAGDTVAIIGPNGSGKSTLLAAIAGLVRPVAGRIRGDRERTALVLQSTDVDRSLPITVAEVVRMGRYRHTGLFRRFDHDDRRAVEEAMVRLDVAGLRHRQLHHLSGGQRQRVLVAQGLAQQADLLLLDEPVTGLDLVSRDRILDVLDEERDAGRAVMMTTHSLEEARRADKVLLLANAAIAWGPPDEVIAEEPLRQAFGDRVLRLAGGGLLMDDPHHDH